MIAPGYENVMLTLTDEKTIVAGLLNAEDAEAVTIKSLTDGSTQRVEKTKIKERISVPSAMPPGLGEVLGKLTPENHALAVGLAAIPEKIRGFGHVKMRHLAAAKADENV